MLTASAFIEQHLSYELLFVGTVGKAGCLAETIYIKALHKRLPGACVPT